MQIEPGSGFFPGARDDPGIMSGSLWFFGALRGINAFMERDRTRDRYNAYTDLSYALKRVKGFIIS